MTQVRHDIKLQQKAAGVLVTWPSGEHRFLTNCSLPEDEHNTAAQDKIILEAGKPKEYK